MEKTFDVMLQHFISPVQYDEHDYHDAMVRASFFIVVGFSYSSLLISSFKSLIYNQPDDE